MEDSQTIDDAALIRTDKIVHHQQHQRAKKIGKDIAFGVQQTVACLLTDVFIDPWVGKWFQKKYGDASKQEVTNAHVIGGELIGDFGGLAAFVGLRHAFRKPFDAMANAVEKFGDKRLTVMGEKKVRGWAKANHIAHDDPRYQAAVDDYKQFQAHNIVDSSLLATTSTVLNIAAQKTVLKNEQPLSVVVASKLIGTAATMGTMLGARVVLPDSTQTLDDELNDRYISRVVRKVNYLIDGKPVHAHDGLHAQAHEQTLS